MATGSSVNKRTLNNMLNSDQGIKRISPVSGSDTEIEPYENVVYITCPAGATAANVILPDPAEVKGQMFLLFVETDATGTVFPKYHKGASSVKFLYDGYANIVASSLIADFTAKGDKLYVISDGERYHILDYKAT